MNILEVEPMKQLIRFIKPYSANKIDTKKPLYRYNWAREGWERVAIWNTTPVYIPPFRDYCSIVIDK